MNAEIIWMLTGPEKEGSDPNPQVRAHVHTDTPYKIVKKAKNAL